MTNQEIAELTTRIVQAAVTSSSLSFNSDAITRLYEQVFNTIKRMDQTA